MSLLRYGELTIVPSTFLAPAVLRKTGVPCGAAPARCGDAEIPGLLHDQAGLDLLGAQEDQFRVLLPDRGERRAEVLLIGRDHLIGDRGDTALLQRRGERVVLALAVRPVVGDHRDALDPLLVHEVLREGLVVGRRGRPVEEQELAADRDQAGRLA